jgi:3,4-dihydroxy 2-butanone 4-phosphate synthase/GTP cyclohydrolase II
LLRAKLQGNRIVARRFSSAEDTIQALAAGRVVIVLDSAARENEGDFLLAADKATPQTIYFMLRHGCGQLCVPVAGDIARRLDLTPMMAENNNPDAPAFAVPIDHFGCHTGISPEERAFTIQAMLAPRSRPYDFVRPGHVFPLIARDGGVLRRAGHTEAAVDLARLAGLAPAGVLCEVCSRDGIHMAGRDELLDVADEFDLMVTTIDDLIRYRQAMLVQKSASPRIIAARAV